MTGSRKYFETVGPKWDDMRQGFFSETVREKAFEVAGAVAGKIAADIGAGSGFVTEGLLRRGLRVIAVDRSEAMLEEMRRKFGAGGAVEYRIGEAESLPLADGSVDYAFANIVLHHVESPPVAISARLPGFYLAYVAGLYRLALLVAGPARRSSRGCTPRSAHPSSRATASATTATTSRCWRSAPGRCGWRRA